MSASNITQPTLTPDQIVTITDYINVYRAKHSAPPLSYNSVVANFSNNWSIYLLKNNLFQHSGSQSYGENLAYFQGYGTDPVSLIKQSIDAWYNEVSLYDFNKPGFSESTGHFTCLVWVASKEFGMGISIDKNTTKAIIVMNTSPPGNIIGEFAQNVLPIVSAPMPVPTPPPPSPVPTPPPSPPPTPPPSPPPSPVPSPLPPSPPSPTNSQNIYFIIYSLNNIIYWINIRKSRTFIISQIQQIINNIISTNIPNSTNIISILQSSIHIIQSNGSLRTVTYMIQNVIHILNYSMYQ